MVSTAVKILVPVAVIAIVGIAFFSVITSPEECRYDYEVELTDSFVGYNGVVEKAGDGKQYAIIHITAANDGVVGGISLNPYTWVWQIVADGIIYTHCLDHYSHPEHGESSMAIDMGSTGSYVVVLEVPKTLTMNDMEVTTEYSSSIVTLIHDDSLIN